MSEPVLINRDEEHLRLLAICYYVFGGFVALMSCFGLLYVFIGLIMTGVAATAHSHDAVPPAVLGVIFALIGAAATVLGVSVGLLLVFAGRSLAQRKRYVFCIVMGAIICLSIPFGTLLGIFTFIVLCRPSVKALFGRQIAPA